MAVDGGVNGFLEMAQAGRLTHLDSLQHKLNEWQQDRGNGNRITFAMCKTEEMPLLVLEELQYLCTEVDQTEGQKINFTKCKCLY